MLVRRSSAVWRGPGLTGAGALSMQSGVFQDQPFSFQTRFRSEDGKAGTNPEELIAAAHAGCFSMALSFMLAGAGHPAEELRTDASLRMDNEGVHWTVTRITLDLTARVPGISEEKFQELAQAAKANCPVSKALSSVEIVLNARLL